MEFILFNRNNLNTGAARVVDFLKRLVNVFFSINHPPLKLVHGKVVL